MNKPGGEAENDEAVSKELNSKNVPGGAEENVEEPKDPNPEEATASGGETRAEPSDNFSITREEQDRRVGTRACLSWPRDHDSCQMA